MHTLGSNVAIFENERILLTLRKDYEVWCLPGGHVDPGESFGQAAIREAREETGLEVKLTQFVGSYSRVNWLNGFYHIHLFMAEVIGGEIIAQPEEVLDIQYFSIDALPQAMLLGHHHRIMDAAHRLIGVVKCEMVEHPFPHLSHSELMKLRDDSPLSPVDFYTQHFPVLTPEKIIVETPGIPNR